MVKAGKSREKSQRKAVSAMQKGEIKALFEEGCSYRVIAGKTGVTKTSVARWVTRYLTLGHMNTMPKSGRPRKLHLEKTE